MINRKTISNKIISNNIHEDTNPKDALLSSESGSLGMGELIAGRVCILSISLLTVTVYTFLSSPYESLKLIYIFYPLAILLGFCAASALWVKYLSLKGKKPGKTFKLLQIIFDITLLTGIVYVTQDVNSPFLFLYILYSGVTSLFLNLIPSLFLVLISSVFYYTLSACIHWNIISSANELKFYKSVSEIVIQVVNLSCGMILVCVIINFLKSKLRSSNIIIETAKKDIKDIYYKQEKVIRTSVRRHCIYRH